MPDGDKVKDALKKDWEQTKADMPGDSGRDTNQSIGDTIRQATGKEDAHETPTERRPQ